MCERDVVGVGSKGGGRGVIYIGKEEGEGVRN